MNRNALLLYLRDLRDLEFARRKIAQMYEGEEYRIKKSLEELGTPKFGLDSEKADFSILTIGFGAAAIVGVIAYFLQWLSSGYTTDILDMLVDFCINVVSKICWGICIVIIITTIVGMVKNIRTATQMKKKNDKERERVEKNKDIISGTRRAWELRKGYLKKEYNRVVKLQNDYYSQNILAAQYRNLPALIYIYQYMSTSKADLEVVLMHTHMEDGIQRIERKLGEIIEQNENIIFAQHIAEAQNSRVIEQNKNMLNSLGRIENNTGDAAYYSRMAANYARTLEFFESAKYLESR